ncbi:alpha/beta hydrolase [Aliikangiella coralliicola]|uniref:Alpha/beta hydrolase n=1 Tax=Aliikangiella coralliicola TaxID=2592383 RepID=A0A545UFI4_9GAMM|nr:alpha/beta hydrolase [Aliikangiella coralliicola]TQV88234.1 alpha/beta hydrolase [Aliikangiella coralliicola]
MKEHDMKDYDKQFNLRKRHPFGRVQMLGNEISSIFTRLKLSNSRNLSYGDTAGQKLDIFPSTKSDSPVFIFIHGGYFRALDKRQYSFLARPLVKAGYTVVLLNYDLVPHVSVAQIIEQNIRALNWIFQNINQFNGDPRQLFLSGHSVGATLVAKLLEHNWSQDMKSSFQGAIMLSGLYDLSTLRQSYLNESLSLSASDVKLMSPVNNKLIASIPLLIAVGGSETDEFIRQSKTYSEKLTKEGYENQFMILERQNHYEVITAMGQPNNVLIKFLSK